jgi:hypothetical protein
MNALPAPLPAPAGLVQSLPAGPPLAPGGLRMEGFDRFHGEAAERAREFAQKRAVEVNEQMLASLARRREVPVDELKRALEHARKGRGWVPKDNDKEPPVVFSQDEARAYFLIERTLPRITPMVVREYAAPRPGADDLSIDSRDTVLWQPVIVLPADGKAKLQFHLGNAAGGYQVVVAGHTLDGRIGAVRGVIPVSPPQLTTPTAPPGQPAPVPPPAP